MANGGGGIPPINLISLDHVPRSVIEKVPGNPNGGGGNPCPGIGGGPPCGASIGFAPACPSAAYEFVIESMTDCAFSCPISGESGRVSHCELCILPIV